MTDYFAKILVESNLLLSHKAIVRNESIETVFTRVNSWATQFYKNYEESGGRGPYILKLWVERRREPNYLLVDYENRKEWIHKAININSSSEILFHQIQNDVQVSVKMYPKGVISRSSKSRFDDERINRLHKNADVAWVDFILEVFRVAGVDNYDEIKVLLLPDEKIQERDRIAKEYRTKMGNELKKIAVMMIIAMIFFWLLGYLLNR